MATLTRTADTAIRMVDMGTHMVGMVTTTTSRTDTIMAIIMGMTTAIRKPYVQRSTPVHVCRSKTYT